MRSIKAKLTKSKPPANGPGINKEDWTKLDQRVWHAVAVNQPAKLYAKLGKHEVNINKLCPSVGYCVVHYAAAKGLDDCLNVLLANKADISTRDITGATPLHVSARYGNKGTTMKLLAASTVDVNAKDNNLYTALHFAAFQGHLECVTLIADATGTDVNCVNKDGRTALMVGAAMGRTNVCKELIKRGVDINHRDSSEFLHSALTLAAEAGHADVVRMLCENGADYTAKLADGRNALDVARSRARRSVVDVLHIIQLTDAAKKTDKRASKTSTSSSKESKPRASSHTSSSPSVDEQHKGVPYIDDLQVAVDTSHHPSTDEHSSGGSSVTTKRSDNHSNSNHPRVQTPSEQPPPTATLSLYNDSRQFGALYDRDVSMYDSRSTLASLSSLDVSLSTSHQQHPPDGAKVRVGVADELAAVKERAAQLEAKLRLVEDVSAEADALRAATKNFEHVVRVLEREKSSLTSECEKLKSSGDHAMAQIQHLKDRVSAVTHAEQKLTQAEQKLAHADQKLAKSEHKLSKTRQQLAECQRAATDTEQKLTNAEYQLADTQERLHQSENRLADVERALDAATRELREAVRSGVEELEEVRVRCEQEEKGRRKSERRLEMVEVEMEKAVGELERLRQERDELVNVRECELQTTEALHTTLNQLIEEFGDDEDIDPECSDNLEQLRNLLLASQTAKRTKRADAEANEKRANSDHDILQAKTREVEELAEELRKSEESHEKIKLENDQLVETMTKMKLDVEMLEKAKKEATAAAAGAETELAKIQRHNKSPGNPQSVSKLQQELAEARDANAKLENELQQQKLNWSAVEATMKRDLNEARLKCSAAQQDIINHEKTLGELRVERNQREARIGELEKEVMKSDAKWKECEVESNRTRQQLTEMTQKCAKLTEEISLLRSGRDELMTKIVTSSNDAERSKVDSLKKQLERLCSHIQESERMYSDTISVYRGHLLKAATGELSPQVAIALKEILKLHEEPQTSAPDPAPFAVVNHDHGD